MPELYIGVISGTSADGIDAALVDFSGAKPLLIDFIYLPFSAEIKAHINQVSDATARITLKDYGSLDYKLGLLFAEAVIALLAKSKYPASAIKAIGSHGQTVHHGMTDSAPFTLQIGDPNIIAESTNITTIADFRRRDIAAQGQGAPLVPAFHQAVFRHPHIERCIVNIGGIANITILPSNPNNSSLGFDTGPGNVLLDQWIHRCLGLPFDEHGNWAKTGVIDYDLVSQLKQDAYFISPPPKSTGKEYFCLDWLTQQIDTTRYKPEDLQASLCYLTAVTICDAIKKHAPLAEQVLICGGGVHNQLLMELLEQNLACSIASSEAYGIHPDHVEAMAFAWLARQTLNGLPGNLKQVTGASREVILGAIYQKC